MQELPGVRAAAIATVLPYSNVQNMRRVAPAEAARATGPDARQPGADGLFCAVTSDFFDAIGVHLLQGRKFTPVEAENRKAPSVAIIDARMAKLLFPDGSALGRRLRYTSPPADGSPAEMEIVGIVSDHRQQPRVGEGDPRLYVPLAQAYSPQCLPHGPLRHGKSKGPRRRGSRAPQGAPGVRSRPADPAAGACSPTWSMAISISG